MPGANAAPRLCRLRWPTMSPVIARCALKGKVTDSYLCMYVCIHLSIHTHINEVSRHNMIIECVEDANGKRRGGPRRGTCGSRLFGWWGVVDTECGLGSREPSAEAVADVSWEMRARTRCWAGAVWRAFWREDQRTHVLLECCTPDDNG